MTKLWRCQICGDGYVGDDAPDNCPFCGAHKKYIVEAKKARVVFDISLTDTDKSNVDTALKLEISNAAFYFCASDKTDDPEGKILFKTLAKVENEHASMWRKVLKLPATPRGSEECHVNNIQNLEESYARESKAIDFYKKAAAESKDPRIRQLFTAVIEVEMDHLALDEHYMQLAKKGE